jgi:hypothetical protein
VKVEPRTIIPIGPSGSSSGAATRLRTPELRMLIALLNRSSSSASSTSAARPFSATSRIRLVEYRQRCEVPLFDRLAAQSYSPSARLRKIAPSAERDERPIEDQVQQVLDGTVRQAPVHLVEVTRSA